MAQHCILIGNPMDGFYTVGPFESAEAAQAYVATERFPENMWVMELYDPAEAADSYSGPAIADRLDQEAVDRIMAENMEVKPATCSACGAVEGTEEWGTEELGTVGGGWYGLCPTCADRFQAAEAKDD